jgi:hypothetical protein
MKNVVVLTDVRKEIAKLNKVEIEVKKEIKLDGRTNNTGRPVNKKSARQARLAKQALYASLNDKFKSGVQFKINNNTYKYSQGDNGDLGCIVDGIGFHQCNVSYIGRTKVECYSFTLGKKVNVTLNLKTLEFVS